MKDLIGQTLGQYRIDAEIGRSGMATLYKAYQPGQGRYVVLKVLPPLRTQQPGSGEAFRREARVIARLNHPNILPVHDFVQQGDYSFIVMRYIEGARTLKEVMAGRLGLAPAAELIGHIAAALDYAHGHGIILCNVNPNNVLVDGDLALLTDFSRSKMTKTPVRLSGTGVAVGTLAYMSPEQGQGKPVDQRTDVYALGIILYEMLTGQIPHDAETPAAIIFKRATEPLPLPRVINPKIPEEVERVMLKALAREPDGRYASAGALAAALNEALSASQPEAPPAPAPSREE